MITLQNSFVGELNIKPATILNRGGSHPLGILIEPLILYSGEGNYNSYGTRLPRINLLFYLRLESLDEGT
ncbi:hypothetical protein BHM03_00061858 [Ensete ventricosum]|nr:hypothetical protein BHM03_00061858 [Ensete ventricosum]